METIFRRVPVTEGNPKEKEIVFAINSGRRVLCEFSEGNFYRSTDDSGNDRLLRFYYTSITHWIEEIELPSSKEIQDKKWEKCKNDDGVNKPNWDGKEMDGFVKGAEWMMSFVLR